MESENNSRPYRHMKAELRSSLRCSRISKTMRKRIPNNTQPVTHFLLLLLDFF